VKSIVRADLVVFGGEVCSRTSLADSPARCCTTHGFLLALLLCWIPHRPVAVIGIGVGPVERRSTRLVLRAALSLTTLVTVRDEESPRILHAIATKIQVATTADPVFTLPAVGSSRHSDDTLSCTRAFCVVVPRYSFTPKQQVVLAWVFDHVIECHKLEIVLVPFQVGFKVGYDDRIVSENIQKLMQKGGQLTHCHAGNVPRSNRSDVSRVDELE
jgi:polysaccharide pyruvyl transferase WcaK-like protein